MQSATLDAYLNTYAGSDDPVRLQIAGTIRAFAGAAVQIRKSINEGALGAAFASSRATYSADGDAQKELDVHADNRFLDAARQAGIAFYASEELPGPVTINTQSDIAVAIDPLDGSSNIDTNVSIGTIFSILPSAGDPEATFAQTGETQLAAGFFIYGPQLALVLTTGSGTRIYVFSGRLGTFVEAYESIVIPKSAREFAVNASNYRHWDEAVRLYVDDCLAGSEGPRGEDFNMRWIASLVADTYRILSRGGVFLYPGDGRRGYSSGRLRLVYEANPIAMLIEQAGGAASDGLTRILELVPHDLHQRTPLIFGSCKEVETIERYHSDPSSIADRHPLFANRGLFRT
ncbi:MAG: class 1 fructose-bisphosphatase [Hyphomicrobiales bacterium]|nr:class 1 fructose-bisphosphatase [Hyphomicrobiales bacterium]